MQEETKSQAACSIMAGVALIAAMAGAATIFATWAAMGLPSASPRSWEELAVINMYAWPATVAAAFLFKWLNDASYNK